jgi:hypothetical protein
LFNEGPDRKSFYPRSYGRFDPIKKYFHQQKQHQKSLPHMFLKYPRQNRITQRKNVFCAVKVVSFDLPFGGFNLTNGFRLSGW